MLKRLTVLALVLAVVGSTPAPMAENLESSISASKLPTANIAIQRNAERDRYDWLAFWAGIALAAAGISGVVAAFRTLKWLRIQTLATKEAAENALLNAQAVINSERAWILVKRPLPPKELVPRGPLSEQALEQEALRLLANDPNYQAANAADRYEMTVIKKEEIRATAVGFSALWVLMFGFRFKVFGNTPAKLVECGLIFRVVEGRKRNSNTEPDFPEVPYYGTPSKSAEIAASNLFARATLNSHGASTCPFREWIRNFSIVVSLA